jgi:hypothetical protein
VGEAAALSEELEAVSLEDALDAVWPVAGACVSWGSEEVSLEPLSAVAVVSVEAPASEPEAIVSAT